MLSGLWHMDSNSCRDEPVGLMIMHSEMGPAPKIAVIDDHHLFLAGFALLMQQRDNPLDVTPFADPAELLTAVETGEKFDLIICDLVMPRMNGLAFAQALRDQSSIPIMILSGINTHPPLSEMKQLGVDGFVHKSADDDVVMDAIEKILAGDTCFPGTGEDGAEDRAQRYGDVSAQVTMDSVPVLTRRQIEVLELISNGASNAQISESLNISENTVKSHLRQIFDLLQVNKRTACVRAAQSFGLI